MSTSFRNIFIGLAAIFVITVLLYQHGLGGPFLFDDNIHIVQNPSLHISSLSLTDLSQAANSSVVGRPLAQVSFGINHATTGLAPVPFKATNLALHLLTGLALFVFSRLAFRALSQRSTHSRDEVLFAFAVSAIWLIHPLHVSTVLYVVQRMTQIATLAMVLGMTSYLWGRLRIAEGRSGVVWIFLSVPLAGIGFLGKETTVLLPLLLLAMELTLLQKVPLGREPLTVRLSWLVLIAAPLVFAVGYLFLNPEILSYDKRPFSLEERLLTQPRVLWNYVQWLFLPDITRMGLFHDDIPISRSLFDPATTLPAIVAWIGLAVTAFLKREHWPVFSFGVLFFLFAHALESTIFPLEMVFEHRNYLASVGPLFFLAYLITVASKRLQHPQVIGLIGLALIVAYSATAYLRVDNWKSYESFVLSSAQNHPGSSRTQFMAGQLAISMLEQDTVDRERLAEAARGFMFQGSLRIRDVSTACSASSSST
jgi:hypothetical protein